MTRTEQLMVGHARVLVRGGDDWAKAVASAIAVRRTRFLDQASYLRLADRLKREGMRLNRQSIADRARTIPPGVTITAPNTLPRLEPLPPAWRDVIFARATSSFDAVRATITARPRPASDCQTPSARQTRLIKAAGTEITPPEVDVSGNETMPESAGLTMFDPDLTAQAMARSINARRLMS